jgi:hypothetical protein
MAKPDFLKFLISNDEHVGWEMKAVKLVPLHDQRAIDSMLGFAQDFKPNIIFQNGDNLDCGPVSHWLKTKKRSTAELRLQKDFDYYDRNVVRPLEAAHEPFRRPAWYRPYAQIDGTRVPIDRDRVKGTGNHEGWITQLLDEQPELEGLVEPEQHLGLEKRNWQVLPQGAVFAFSDHLAATHGDNLPGGGENLGKGAVLGFETNIRFGHHHTYQVYTKHNPLDATQVKTGVALPCLCNRAPEYGKKKPNKWVKGFAYGYLFPDGTFNDYVAIVVNNRVAINGKVYRG